MLWRKDSASPPLRTESLGSVGETLNPSRRRQPPFVGGGWFSGSVSRRSLLLLLRRRYPSALPCSPKILVVCTGKIFFVA
ncbi:hypothetical protein S245_023314 [Arachis hypogaea]